MDIEQQRKTDLNVLQYQIVLYVDQTDSGINLSLAYQCPVIGEGGAARLMKLIHETVTMLIGNGDRTLPRHGGIEAV